MIIWCETLLSHIMCLVKSNIHFLFRFAIDTMQSVCLDEFGGEKAVHPSYQETTLIQHIFGGRLRSQVAFFNEA